MKQEHFLIFAVGALILTYVLDALVNPLPIELTTPYHYFSPENMFTYPFTSTSIILKSIVVLIASLLTLSMLGFKKLTKGLILLVLSGLMQLYSLQAMLTNSDIIPLEWSLSLTLAGMILLALSVFYIIVGFTQKFTKAITEDPYSTDSTPEVKEEN